MLLPALSAGAQTGETVGRVITTVGEVMAIGPDGERRALQRRSEIHEGETVVTGEGGRAQVRFKDKGLVDLKSDTRFTVERYRAQAAGDTQDSAVMELIKGGMRTVTGSVGGGKQQEYEVETPVASIGIRGTQYQLRLCQGDCGPDVAEGLYGGVSEGRIGVTNNAGTSEFGGDRFFHVASSTARPKGLLTPPKDLISAAAAKAARQEGGAEEGADTEGGDEVAEDEGGTDDGSFLNATAESDPSQPTPEVTEDFEATEDVDDSGTSQVVREVDNQLDGVMAGGYAAAQGDLDRPVEGGILPTYERGVVYLDDQGRVIGVEVEGRVGREAWIGSSGSYAEDRTYSGSNFTVDYGRWSGEFRVVGEDIAGGSKLTNGDLHYAYSQDYTTPTQLGKLSGSVIHTLAKHTEPTDLYGGSYNLDTFRIEADLGVPAITSAGMSMSGPGYVSLNYSGTQEFGPEAVFFLSKDQFQGIETKDSGRLEGHFLGDQAQGIVLQYEVIDRNSSGDEVGQITGTAVLE